MNIHLVLVAYALAQDVLDLYRSLDGPNITWHLFLHSQVPAVVQVCEALAKRLNVVYYDYGTNRGLAKSWNEGLIAAKHLGADVMMIANDDVRAFPLDMQRLSWSALEHPECYYVSGWGYDEREGKAVDTAFALCVVNPIAMETIGYFDENFFPVYFEDVDWFRRAELAGLARWTVPHTTIRHAGSKSLSETPAHEHFLTFVGNREYYRFKWGGEPGQETYRLPFNDPALDLRIGAERVGEPYPGYDRLRHPFGSATAVSEADQTDG